jgi:hypothetical protein
MMLAEPEFVRCMSSMLTLGARPEADLCPDIAEDRSEDLLNAWTCSGELARPEAETLLALDRSTPWRTSA